MRVSPAVDRVRVLLAAAAWPLLTGYAAIVALLAVVNALATQAEFSVPGVLLAAGPGWLAAYQVPLTIDGQQLGVLPLVLTVGVGVLVARSAGYAAERLRYSQPQQSITVIGVLAGAHALTGVTIAVLANGSPVSVEPLAAFGLPALISGIAATVGLSRRCGLHTA
ncbi:MAG: cell division protein PerM, partial [Pseudonocardiaceae bacterium]